MQRLTSRQQALCGTIDQFMVDDKSHTLVVLSPRIHAGTSSAITSWITQCTRQQCDTIALMTFTLAQALDLLEEAERKKGDRMSIRKDTRSLLDIEGLPHLRVHACANNKTLRGFGRTALTIYVNTVFTNLSDEVITALHHPPCKSVWIMHADDIERAERLFGRDDVCFYTMVDKGG